MVNKVVAITGAGSGIGRATAVKLSLEGHHVVLTGRRPDRLSELAAKISADGGRATAMPVDVTDRLAMTSAIDSVIREVGRLDVMMCNAGVMPLSRLDSLLVDQWDQMIDVNVRGLLHSIAAALPHFQRQEHGHFVTMTSIASHQVVPMSAVYSATKFATRAITEGLRLESSPGVRVTAISPGMVATELSATITDAAALELVGTVAGIAISPESVASAISYAISQPPEVDVSEIIVRPAAQRP